MNALDYFGDKVIPEPNSGCWIWLAGLKGDGYDEGKGYGATVFEGRRLGAHRVSWLLSEGAVPAGLLVLHKCDNSRCVNPRHLYVGTSKDNARDLRARGKPYWRIMDYRTPEIEARRLSALRRGVKHPRGTAKINAEIARAIYSASGTLGQIGAAHGLSPMAVSDIKRRRTWGHIHA